WRALNRQLRASDDVDLALTNRKRFQRMVIPLGLCDKPLWPAAWPEGEGKLRDGEETFAVELFSFLLRHPGQEAEVVFFNRFLPTLSLELALHAMPIQDKVGRHV